MSTGSASSSPLTATASIGDVGGDRGDRDRASSGPPSRSPPSARRRWPRRAPAGRRPAPPTTRMNSGPPDVVGPAEERDEQRRPVDAVGAVQAVRLGSQARATSRKPASSARTGRVSPGSRSRNAARSGDRDGPARVDGRRSEATACQAGPHAGQVPRGDPAVPSRRVDVALPKHPGPRPATWSRRSRQTMLWRVRTTLPDRPGALALLARAVRRRRASTSWACRSSRASRRSPTSWCCAPRTTGARPQIGALVERPAARRSVATRAPRPRWPTSRPATCRRPAPSWPAGRASPRWWRRLFDAEADPVDGARRSDDVMEMTVGDVSVQVRRAAPFTATEHARGAAMADLVTDVLARGRGGRDPAPSPRPPGRRRRHSRRTSSTGDRSRRWSTASRSGGPCSADAVEPGVRRVTSSVDPAWQRRGIGTRLLVDAARLARRPGRRRDPADHPLRQPGGAADGAGRRAARPDPDGRRRAHRPDPVRDLKPLRRPEATVVRAPDCPAAVGWAVELPEKFAALGLTYDDVLLLPGHSDLAPDRHRHDHAADPRDLAARCRWSAPRWTPSPSRGWRSRWPARAASACCTATSRSRTRPTRSTW